MPSARRASAREVVVIKQHRDYGRHFAWVHRHEGWRHYDGDRVAIRKFD